MYIYVCRIWKTHILIKVDSIITWGNFNLTNISRKERSPPYLDEEVSRMEGEVVRFSNDKGLGEIVLKKYILEGNHYYFKLYRK